MNKKSGTSKDAADKLVRGIRRKTRKHYSAEEKIRFVLAGLRGEESIAALCRREGIAESLYYTWSCGGGKNAVAYEGYWLVWLGPQGLLCLPHSPDARSVQRPASVPSA